MPTDARQPREQSPPTRLSIAYLLCLTMGVGMVIAAAGAIKYLRFPADAYFFAPKSGAQLNTLEQLVAALYGLCLTTFLFAVRSGSFWSSPGKVLALLFAAMCVVDWGLQAVAGVAVSVQLTGGMPQSNPNQTGYLLGIWYGQFAPAIGYVFAVPLLLVVLWKTRVQGAVWSMVWLGFLVFALLVLVDIHFSAGQMLPPFAQRWYFETAIGIPVVLIVAALLVTLAGRERLDWWTAIVSLPLVFGWATLVGLKIWRM